VDFLYGGGLCLLPYYRRVNNMKKFIFGMALSLIMGLCVTTEAFQSSTDKALSDNIRQGDGKIVMGGTDYGVDVPADFIDDEAPINAYGRAATGVQTTATDIWDLADATPTQQIWTAPTSAQTHWIVSSSASDSSAGVGARKIRVYGLIDWDTPEITEDIVTNGTTSVTTTQSYVIINRLEVLTKGATNVNVGAISAFATTDRTTTARILAGIGETQMAILGISSVEDAFISEYYGSVNTTATLIDFSLHVNTEPDSELTNFARKNTIGTQATGSSYVPKKFSPNIKIDGPAIIKVQGLASASDTAGSAGFDGVRKIREWTLRDYNVVVSSHRNRDLDHRILKTSDGRIIRTTQTGSIN
jgi:hypothetical protein|tara:strand:- start:373 stop:1449 length:1077 start_codon:yes stop_codon:yes gene_type:complete